VTLIAITEFGIMRLSRRSDRSAVAQRHHVPEAKSRRHQVMSILATVATQAVSAIQAKTEATSSRIAGSSVD
jgi:hypothetical protein